MKHIRGSAIFSIGTLLLCFMGLLAVLPSCRESSISPAEADKIGVVVTIAPLADFVKQVGGDRVRVTIMVEPGQDPHSASLNPSRMMDVSEADIYFMVGAGLEYELAHMEQIKGSNSKMQVADCSSGITLLEGTCELDEDAGEDQGQETHGEQGHEGKDPHIWASPINAKIMVEHICEGLTTVDSAHADYYAANKKAYLDELDLLDGYIRYKFDGLNNRAFLTYHPAFGYFVHEYAVNQIAVEHAGKTTTAQPRVAGIEDAHKYHLQYVFVSPQVAPDISSAIATDIGGSAVVVDALSQNYISSMKSLTDLLAQEFEP